MAIALVNVIGPDGLLLVAGQPIPQDWPSEILECLLETGGAQADPDEGGGD